MPMALRMCTTEPSGRRDKRSWLLDPMNGQELSASSLVAQRLSRRLGSERAATAAADIAAALRKNLEDFKPGARTRAARTMKWAKWAKWATWTSAVHARSAVVPTRIAVACLLVLVTGAIGCAATITWWRHMQVI